MKRTAVPKISNTIPGSAYLMMLSRIPLWGRVELDEEEDEEDELLDEELEEPPVPTVTSARSLLSQTMIFVASVSFLMIFDVSEASDLQS